MAKKWKSDLYIDSKCMCAPIMWHPLYRLNISNLSNLLFNLSRTYFWPIEPNIILMIWIEKNLAAVNRIVTFSLLYFVNYSKMYHFVPEYSWFNIFQSIIDWGQYWWNRLRKLSKWFLRPFWMNAFKCNKMSIGGTTLDCITCEII